MLFPPVILRAPPDLTLKMGTAPGLSQHGYQAPENGLKGLPGYSLERRNVGTLIEDVDYTIDPATNNWTLINLLDVIQGGEYFILHFYSQFVQGDTPVMQLGPNSFDPNQYIVDAIGQCIAAADSVTYPIIGKHINYLYGHYQDIVDALQREQASTDPVVQAARYPLVALFEDIRERRGQAVGIYSTSTLNLAIAMYADPNLTPQQREQQTLRPTLYPIYNALMDALAQKTGMFFASEDQIVHTKINRKKWGVSSTGTPGMFSDTVDAIEIQNLEVKFYIEDYDPATFPAYPNF